MPELKFDIKNLDFGPFKFNEEFIIARYQEFQYNAGTKERTGMPFTSDFTIEPNTYIFKQSLSTSFANFSFTTGLDQYVFKIPGKGLFEGDAMYNYSLDFSYKNTFYDFITTKTSYRRTFSHEDGNSPFFAFDAVNYFQIPKIAQGQDNETPTKAFELIEPWKEDYGYYLLTEPLYDCYETLTGSSHSSAAAAP